MPNTQADDPRPRVFIMYRRKDAYSIAWRDRLDAELEAHGIYSEWDEKNQPVADDHREANLKRIEDFDAVVLLVVERIYKDKSETEGVYTHRLRNELFEEWKAAERSGKEVICVMLEERVRPPYGQGTWPNPVTDESGYLKRLVTCIWDQINKRLSPMQATIKQLTAV